MFGGAGNLACEPPFQATRPAGKRVGGLDIPPHKPKHSRHSE
jgi:hypothetical protein